MKYILLLFTLTLLPQTVASQKYDPLAFDTGNDVYFACTSQDTVYMVACRSFISGVTIGYGVTSDAEKTIKIPDEATHQQIYDVVINFITQHPEKRHQTSVALIVRALHDAWPAK